MITEREELGQLLRTVMRGLWSRRRPTPELLALVAGEPPLARRHVAVLAHVAGEGERTVSEIAQALGLTLPAVSKLTRELEDHRLVARREDPADRRRTVVGLHDDTAAQVRSWTRRRSAPLDRALEALSAEERAAFLKGLRALADALMEESACGSQRPHHRAPHRRGPHRHRPV